MVYFPGIQKIASSRIILLLNILLIGFTNISFTQSITGPICVLSGTQYTYTYAGSWTNSTNMVWTITGAGTFSGSSNGTPLPQVHVTWTGTGTLKVVTTNPTSSVTINVSLAPTLNGGTLGNPSQTINTNAIPATINNLAAASGGSCSPTYNYQWQSSPNNVSYSNINGATSLSLSFTTGLTTTTYYRRMVTETSSNTTAYSNVATVTVLPPLVSGSISLSSQSIYYNTPPGLLTLSGVSGGTNSYTYYWQSSTDGLDWSYIFPYVNGTTYQAPALTSTTYYRVAVTSNYYTVNSSTAIVIINPQLMGGQISPSNTSVNSGTSPGELTGTTATGGGCSGSYTYQWQSSIDGINFATISGDTSKNYTSGTLTSGIWYRRQVTCSGVSANSNICQVTINTGIPDMNFITTRTILKAGVTDSVAATGLTSPFDVSQVTQFLDGLGRVVQTVAMKQTPLQNDMVSVNSYDNYGREVEKYLPYPATTNDGNFKPTAFSDQYNFNSAQYTSEQYYYSIVNYESSPLNRVMNTYAPGINWAGSTRGVNQNFLVNQASDSVRSWNIAYPIGSIPTSTSMYGAGTLYKSITTDEMGHQVVEYKDMSGHVVLNVKRQAKVYH